MEYKTVKNDTLNDFDKTNKTRHCKPKEEFKEKECKVIKYNSYTKSLDINFDGYGIRIKNAEYSFNNSSIAKVKYKGEIGKPNFIIKV